MRFDGKAVNITSNSYPFDESLGLRNIYVSVVRYKHQQTNVKSGKKLKLHSMHTTHRQVDRVSCTFYRDYIAVFAIDEMLGLSLL
jgi:hypothetical protein